MNNILDVNDEWDDVDKEWDDFINDDIIGNIAAQHTNAANDINEHTDEYNNRSDKISPTGSPLVISTKSKEFFLGCPIDLQIFWKIKLNSYDMQHSGVIKKQMRFQCNTETDYDNYILMKNKTYEEVIGCHYMQELVIKHMDVQKANRRFFNYF